MGVIRCANAGPPCDSQMPSRPSMTVPAHHFSEKQLSEWSQWSQWLGLGSMEKEMMTWKPVMTPGMGAAAGSADEMFCFRGHKHV